MSPSLPSLGKPVWAIIGLGILLRLLGVVVNYEANDPHLDVIHVIAYEQRFPADDELWEAFQPKLYHTTVAVLLRLLPELTAGEQTRVAQAVSCLAGIATLFVLITVIRQLRLTSATQQATAALVALNPLMIATSIQATNDAFVILFASMALAAGYRFFTTFDSRAFATMTAGALLAGIAKGNGLVVAIAITCTFGAALLLPTVSRQRILALAVCFLLAFAAFVPPVGGYWTRYQVIGTPFAINQQPVTRPDFLQESFIYSKRAGITSIVHGFLTFRLINMLEYPTVKGDDVFPAHRTSFWSLVYGGAHSVHYEYWPPTWRSDHPGVLWLLRAVWILALAPTAVLIVGALRNAAQLVADGIRRTTTSQWAGEFLIVICAGGYLGFLMLYGYQYRDYATMKPIFIGPAAVSFIVFFSRELDRIGAHRRLLSTICHGSAALLCLAYAADVSTLLWSLAFYH